MSEPHRPILLAGPTASGKSGMALDLAARLDGVIINADSMQVYAGLRILTARPSAEDEAAAPHRLYGYVPPDTRYSVGRWLTDVAAAVDEARQAAHTPIVVGGTGLYFKALIEGLSAIPPVPSDLRARLAAEAEGIDTPTLHARLAEVDPESADSIRPSDRARVVRAIEVFEATGRGLVAWQRRSPATPVLDPRLCQRMVLGVDRAVLHHRIAERAAHMVHHGAVEEVRALAGLGLDPAAPAMKAIGVRELLAHLRGDITLAEAVAAMATETRRYARRQMTWFRNQMPDWSVLPASPEQRP